MAESVVQQQYDQLAEIYDRRWRSYITKTLLFLEDWAKIQPSEIILDIACGTGEFERLLLEEHPQQAILGIDLSSEMLSVARKKLKDYAALTFRQSSVTVIPAANESFDVVICASAFHYFESPLEALAEIRRVLKPEGRVVILDWCKDFLFCRLYDVILSRLDPAHRQCYTQAEFHRFLTSSQFSIQAAQRLRLNLAWGLMVATAVKP
ncbi:MULTISPECIES: methyltransferase domain-containing protein [Cyanophyceae]|uniref:class I SAM-dependent methyltransferase n=1 Tax=Cyanophyceae TaxID=3028117 RepID=UPI00168518CE|nr:MULTISPECIES: methyltransferase domain-containing protein [Cyanophyceae]MBD1918409.1 methyltransferase domain-containing protein [Phormidium sp. FACHB-77]MBD2028722.1 methyltransferase domain-containing protein [Phormidium sp. FACHB-322]MBD2051143.1 methyltransferase domain-containing protein [Leptolyngbya sp. FACHB-60]